MPTNLKASIKVAIVAAFSSSLDLSTPEDQLTYSKNTALANGTSAAQADLIFRLRIINCDITIFLSICQFFTIWGPLNSHHPVISFDLFHGSLSEEIPQTNSAVS